MGDSVFLNLMWITSLGAYVAGVIAKGVNCSVENVDGSGGCECNVGF